MRLSLSRADVVGPDGTAYQAVSVQTRNERLVLQTRTGQTILTVAASAVRAGAVAREWNIETADGVFRVSRKAGCGCR